MKAVFALCVCALPFFCLGGTPVKKVVPDAPPQLLTYEVLSAWHKAGGLASSQWPKRHELDLNGDGSKEVFLAVGGFNRGMSYALFTHTKTGWKLLCEQVEASHFEPELRPQKHDGWHDFVTMHPSGRGGLWEYTSAWNGKAYEFKVSREITE